MSENKINYRHWLHQVYEQRWQGTVVTDTVAGPMHAFDNPQWCCTMTASGAVVQDQTGKNVTLEAIEGEAEARSKREAEQQAAKQVYDRLVDEGLYDPSKPVVKMSGGVSRAGRFITDNLPANEHNPLAYLDISIDGSPVGRIVLELFRYKKGNTLQEHAPLAVENFLALCAGVDVGARWLSYAGVPFTRIMHRFIIQAGDVLNKDGTGAAHIHTAYGDNFPDEGLEDKNCRFSHPFMLACANRGLEDTNSSQFFITLAPAAHLAGKHTCFGKVLAGFGVIKEIEALGDSSIHGTPRCPVLIAAAGGLPPGTDVSATPTVSAAGWPLWAEDQGPPPEGVREAAFRLDIAQQLKAAGNEAYKQADAAAALARYLQAARFLSWPSFKLRDSSGDVDLDYDEQRALWDAELLLWGNAAAAHLKLGQYRQALQSCQGVLQREPRNVKALLRAAQAHIGLGAGEFDAAGQLLQQALDQAKEQQMSTRDIVSEMLRLRSLQKEHAAQLRSKFSEAFQSGLLRLPADEQAAAASSTSTAAHNEAAAAAAAAGLRHVVVSPDRRVPGPVPVERVLYSEQPVMLEDAWGSHLLVADEDADSESQEDSNGTVAATSYSRGLTARLQKLGLLPHSEGYGAGDYDSDEEGDWWADGHGESERGEDPALQQRWAAVEGASSPAAVEGASSPAAVEGAAALNGTVTATAAVTVNGSAAQVASSADERRSSDNHAAAVDVDSVAAAAADVADVGVPEAHEAQEVAADGVAMSSAASKGRGSYGDGALGSLPTRVALK